MSRQWQASYENLGDVSDSLRDAIKMLRKAIPSCLPGPNPQPSGPVDVVSDLQQRLQEMEDLLKRFENDRKNFYVSHETLPTAKPRTAFAFGPLPAVESA
ncbi:hypothetical protein [Paraburkholderia sp. J8-2]|uniref:hypothetical protein n=1 Tax=Paraburkholderia sp. J8-2 TaxID=2805440 RepID=UPI002AB691DE|nr:hypothetical protein [Paraburkholderia sp. J8-2]